MPMAAGKSIPSEWAGKFPIMGGVKPEEWDGFHDFVIRDELNRVGGIGYVTTVEEVNAEVMIMLGFRTALLEGS